MLLVDRFWGDLAAVAPDHVLEDLAHVVHLVERAENGIHGRRADLVAAFDELDQLVDDRARLVHPLVFPSIVSRFPRSRIVHRRRPRSASSTPSPIEANSAATSFETSSTCCTALSVGAARPHPRRCLRHRADTHARGFPRYDRIGEEVRGTGPKEPA